MLLRRTSDSQSCVHSRKEKDADFELPSEVASPSIGDNKAAAVPTCHLQR